MCELAVRQAFPERRGEGLGSEKGCSKQRGRKGETEKERERKGTKTTSRLGKKALDNRGNNENSTWFRRTKKFRLLIIACSFFTFSTRFLLVSDEMLCAQWVQLEWVM